jgi:hypothetical protein
MHGLRESGTLNEMQPSTALLVASIVMSAVACTDSENVGFDGRVDAGDRDGASSSDASGDPDDAPLSFDAPTDDSRTDDAPFSSDAPANDAPSNSDATMDVSVGFDGSTYDVLVSDGCGVEYTKTGDYGPGFVFCCDGSDTIASYMSCTPVTIVGNCMSATTTAGSECGSMNCTTCK